MSDKRADDPAMADILASIRRIVSDEERGRTQRSRSAMDDDELLVLTREMQIEDGARQPEQGAANAMFGAQPRATPTVVHAEPTSSPDARAPSPDDGLVVASALDLDADGGLDEAAIADIVRQVLREEFEGDFGRNLTQQIRRLVHAEVTRAMASPGGEGA